MAVRIGDPTRAIDLMRVRHFRARLLAWYRIHKRAFPWRSPNASAFLHVLTEVLVQQTRAEAVANVLPVFLDRYRTWETIARAKTRDLERALRPLGLWRRRASALKGLSKAVVKLGEEWPSSRAELEQMPAVGPYVASAVLLFVHGQREPLLDVNMARVLERYFGPRTLADIRYDPYLQWLCRRVVDSRTPRDVNWAILDFGALCCTAQRPQCHSCVLRQECSYFRARGG